MLSKLYYERPYGEKSFVRAAHLNRLNFFKDSMNLFVFFNGTLRSFMFLRWEMDLEWRLHEKLIRKASRIQKANIINLKGTIPTIFEFLKAAASETQGIYWKQISIDINAKWFLQNSYVLWTNWSAYVFLGSVTTNALTNVHVSTFIDFFLKPL